MGRRLLLLSGLALCAGAEPAHAQFFGAPRELPKPFARYSDAALAVRDSLAAHLTGPGAAPAASGGPRAAATGEAVVARARTELGTRYRLGAAAPGRAFDCSGFVRWVLAAFDVSLPRTSREQARLGQELPRDTAHLRPGDLLTFGTKARISHVGIYVGEGRYIHASSVRRGVTESSLIADERRGWWRGARRVLPAAADDAPVVPASGR
ncbi:MAG: C40 family peptidase [Gemmatimonadota bacterium]|nr:C40 family peptidase [Gemmatimonadota bacterium]